MRFAIRMTYQDGQKVDCGGKAGTTSTPALPIALETIMNLCTWRTATFLLWAVGLIVTVAFEATAGERAGNASDQSRLIGVFTGRFANGMPIYQLPPITVVANRNAELAKIKEQSARTKAVSRGARRTAAVDLQPGGV
ncbi:MAG TPA: hypothetical protein VGR42_03565 [Casimicrobiaceae bacterium]|nr:hypothetical protein [Casimicrobiaceae bacterium]